MLSNDSGSRKVPVEWLIIIVPLLLIGAFFLWSRDGAGKKAAGADEAKRQVIPRRVGSSIGQDAAQPGAADEVDTVGGGSEGALAGLTFRYRNMGIPISLNYAEYIEAFSFLGGNQVVAISDATALPGTYTMAEDTVIISLQSSTGLPKITLKYRVAEQALRGPGQSVYHLRGGEIDAEDNHREMADRVVNTARIYEAAIDQWAIENNKTNSDKVEFGQVSDYIKASHEVVRNAGRDVLGNEYQVSTVQNGVKVNPVTYQSLSDVTQEGFWSSYAPD